MLFTTCLGLFLPLLSFLGLVAFSRKLSRNLTGIIACSVVFISFICFSSLFIAYANNDWNPTTLTLWNWIPVQGINADFALHLDPLSLFMTLIITGVGFVIHVFSIGYMDHEEDYVRFFACLNFFIFAMLLLVLGANLLVLFVGWEGVGLASYLLIGFWYQRPEAAAAATKAFVVNRIGDCGFLVGLLFTFFYFGTSDIAEISKMQIGAPIIGLITLLYFIGATGKSAQIPLHTWLPDAMAGPTPVSALIHAATMVTAGVYLVVRLHSLFLQAPDTLYIVGLVGAITALFAALSALSQTDLKRVLAYSTVSQLGYMFMACGVGAFYAAMFHLMNHAFMKGLLFLAAGNVVHMMHGETQMEKMGGLAKKMPVTNWLFLIGVISMAGVPPLAAFFSKDLILEQDYLAGFPLLFWLGLITSVITAFYLTRAYILTFTGDAKHKDVQEAPRVMLIPVAILAFLSIIGGFLGFSFYDIGFLEAFLGEVGVTLYEHESAMEFLFSWETLLSILGVIVGIGAAILMYTRFTDRIGKTIEVFKRAFYIDEIYDAVIVLPLAKVSQGIAQFWEPNVMEASLRGVAHTTQSVAGVLQRIQSGQIRSYVAWMALGTTILIIYMML